MLRIPINYGHMMSKGVLGSKWMSTEEHSKLGIVFQGACQCSRHRSIFFLRGVNSDITGLLRFSSSDPAALSWASILGPSYQSLGSPGPQHSGAQMVYIPVGKDGVLIYIGGTTQPRLEQSIQMVCSTTCHFPLLTYMTSTRMGGLTCKQAEIFQAIEVKCATGFHRRQI